MRKILSVFFVIVLLAACAKKLPPAEPFDAEKSFSLGNQLYKKKKYEDARREFYDIKRRETILKYAPLAQLRIADSYVDEDEEELAVKEYRNFLDEYPGHSYAPYAQYRVAMLYYKQVKDAQRSYGAASKALDEFEKLNDSYPRNPYREDLEPRMKRCRDIIAEHEYLVGDFYFRAEGWEGAIERLTGMINDFPGSSWEADALYRVSISYKALGKTDKAIEYFNLLMKKHPDTEAVRKASGVFGADSLRMK